MSNEELDLQELELEENDLRDIESSEEQSLTISYSKLRLLYKSPIMYKRVYIDKIKPPATEASSLGTAVHRILLEPELFEKSYLIEDRPDGRTTIGKAKKLELLAEATESKREILYTSDANRCREIARLAQEHPQVGPYLKEIASEVELNWEEELIKAGSVKAKAFLDLYNPGKASIGEIKVFSGMYKPYKFSFTAKDEAYHVQAGLYRNGAIASSMPVEDFKYILVAAPKKKEGVAEIALAEPEEDYLIYGAQKAKLLGDELIARIKNDDWVSYKEVIPVRYIHN
jgi:exodeoxyribonuclease VIII